MLGWLTTPIKPLWKKIKMITIIVVCVAISFNLLHLLLSLLITIIEGKIGKSYSVIKTMSMRSYVARESFWLTYFLLAAEKSIRQ